MTALSPAPEPPQTIVTWAKRLGALACFAVAAGILAFVGLPDRAEAIALYTLPDGRHIAPEIGAIAPTLALFAADGELIRLSDYDGRVVVLNYWATWCAPCQIEMPALQTLADRYPQQVVVLGINAGEPVSLIRQWGVRFRLSFPLLADPDGVTADIYRLRGQPTTIIVAPDGVIDMIYYGPADLHTLENTVSALLAAHVKGMP